MPNAIGNHIPRGKDDMVVKQGKAKETSKRYFHRIRVQQERIDVMKCSCNEERSNRAEL